MPKTATANPSVRPRFGRATRALAGFWLVSCSGVLAAVPSAAAHDALPTAAKPQGWSYPFYCCSGYDCRAVPQTAISERPEGYVIKGTGEVVAYRDTRLKDSPD